MKKTFKYQAKSNEDITFDVPEWREDFTHVYQITDKGIDVVGKMTGTAQLDCPSDNYLIQNVVKAKPCNEDQFKWYLNEFYHLCRNKMGV